MGVNKVVCGTVAIMDISGSTVTPETLGEGATAYDKSGEKITGTMKGGIDTSDATATASDMAQGVTAYVNGEKVTGTLEALTSLPDVTQNVAPTMKDGYIYASAPNLFVDKAIVARGVGMKIGTTATQFGDATAADVAAGKTFTSAAGVKVVGTAEAGGGSGGGSVETCTGKVTYSDMDIKNVLTPTCYYTGDDLSVKTYTAREFALSNITSIKGSLLYMGDTKGGDVVRCENATLIVNTSTGKLFSIDGDNFRIHCESM